MYVELDGIYKRFGNFCASKNVSFSIEKGKLVGLLGPSGSGKTTILRMIAGLETPDEGVIRIGGRRVNELAPSERQIGFVFQNYALFRGMTIEENIGFGLTLKKMEKRVIHNRVNELLELTGLSGLNRRYPHQLSGGQRQRVAFARAIAPHPELLLLDEPFAAIDAKVRGELRSWLKKMIAELGITSIFVTHDQEEAIEAADEIIVMEKGEVIQKGTPLEIYQRPEAPFTARFIGQASRIANYEKFKSFRHIEEADAALVRPEAVLLARDDEEMKYASSAVYGTVLDVSFRGAYLEIEAEVSGERLFIRRSPDAPPVQKGERVRIFIKYLYVLADDQVYRLDNQALGDPVVVI